MKNYARMYDKDDEIAKELEIAGIKVLRLEFLREQREVKTSVAGDLCLWSFYRNWYYWAAKGPGISLVAAMPFWEKWGKEARAEGDCVCRSPLFWNCGFGTGSYHIDTQEALNAFAELLNSIYVKDAKKEEN